MALTTAEMDQLESLLAASDGGPRLSQDIRALLPGRSLTRCDASDMDAEEPFRRFDRRHLYLVDSRDHCWRITTDPAVATGIVVAERKGSA